MHSAHVHITNYVYAQVHSVQMDGYEGVSLSFLFFLRFSVEPYPINVRVKSIVGFI